MNSRPSPTAMIAFRKAGRFAMECAAYLLALVVLGTALLGG